ncbi:hypothetical protein PIB30_104626, partial [Stylosanthes scabra]|nr:hypothetical protein [Stylosanthes scabra]
QHRRVEENLQYLERREPPTAPRRWRRHHRSGDDTTDPRCWTTAGETRSGRQLQGDFKAAMEVAITSICSAGDCSRFSLQKGQRGRQNKAGAVGERLGMWVLGFTGLKKMRKEEICCG